MNWLIKLNYLIVKFVFFPYFFWGEADNDKHVYVDSLMIILYDETEYPLTLSGIFT